MKKFGFIGFSLMAVLTGCTLFNGTAQKKFENNYFEVMCGSWVNKAVIKDPDGNVLVEPTATWTCVYNEDEACYQMTVESSSADGKPTSFSTKYHRISPTKASSESQYLDITITNVLEQTDRNTVIGEGLFKDDSLARRSVITFDENTMVSLSTNYDTTGQIITTVESISTRQQ